jgi:hypothetical protein
MLLKTTITDQVLENLKLNLETDDLAALLWASRHNLLQRSHCALTGVEIFPDAHLVEGLGYVSTESAAVLMIRGLVEYIDGLTEQKPLSHDDFAERASTALKPFVGSPITPELVRDMANAVDPLVAEAQSILDNAHDLARVEYLTDNFMARVRADSPVADAMALEFAQRSSRLGSKLASVPAVETETPAQVPLYTEPTLCWVRSELDGKTVQAIMRPDGPHEICPHADGTFGERMDPIGRHLTVEEGKIRAKQELERLAREDESRKIKRGENVPGLTWVTKGDGSLTGQVVIAKGARVNILNLPPGTGVRWESIQGPATFHEDPRLVPSDGSPVCAGDYSLVRTQWDEDHGIVVPPAITRNWSGPKIFETPAVDFSKVAASDREVFEGYKPGIRKFSCAEDTYRYEQEVGGDILEAVEAAFAESDMEEFGKVITDKDVEKERGRVRGNDGSFTVRTSKGTRR